MCGRCDPLLAPLGLGHPSRPSGGPPQQSEVVPRHEPVRGANNPASRLFGACDDVGHLPAAAAARDALADRDVLADREDPGPPSLRPALLCPGIGRRMRAVTERIAWRPYVTTNPTPPISRGDPKHPSRSRAPSAFPHAMPCHANPHVDGCNVDPSPSDTRGNDVRARTLRKMRTRDAPFCAGHSCEGLRPPSGLLR
jgi:hypothetical protein